jgi:hypothetical protein
MVAVLVPGWTSAAAMAAPVLRSAEVRIAFQSPAACSVDLSVTIEQASQVEHRIEILDGARVDLIGVTGAAPVAAPRDVGRTRALVLEPEAATYILRYTVEQPVGPVGRCPLWIPTVPADLRAASVRLIARLPGGARASGTMPSFTWSGDEGTAAIGHLPAFVRVPYAMPGEPAPWNIAAIMDAASIAVLLASTLAWARHRRRRNRGLAP